MFRTKVVEKNKTHILHPIHFLYKSFFDIIKQSGYYKHAPKFAWSTINHDLLNSK